MRIAITGLGWWGKQIIRCLAGSRKLQVLYGVDPYPPSDIGAFAAEFGFELRIELNEVLADEAVDGIVVATPHALHEEQVLAAVGAGKNAFCEKPLTMTAAGAKRVIDACGRAGKVLGIGHERRYEPAFEELRRLIDTGALGKLLYLDANVSNNMLGSIDAANWRRNPVHAPAGPMTGVGVHLTDLFISFAGRAKEVRARGAAMVLPLPTEDFITAEVVFESGVRAALTCLAATPYYGRLTVYGERGWAEVINEANVDKGKPAKLTYSDGKDSHTSSYEDVNTVRLNLESWCDAVEGRGTYRFTSEQLLENVRVFEAAVQSIDRDGAAIALTC